MAVHELGAVDIAVYSVDVAFASVLPEDIFVAISHSRSRVLIKGYEKRIVLKTAVGEVFVVEIDLGVKYGRTSIVILHPL